MNAERPGIARWLKSRARDVLVRTGTASSRGLYERLRLDLDRNACLAAQALIRQNDAAGAVVRLRDAEFRVFSQYGEDGIIQFLVRHVPIENDAFIEFGVSGYEEANTRFLLVNNNWRGLIIDGDPALPGRMRDDFVNWRHEITAVSSFVTAENINTLFTDAGFTGDIGLLSIDIDGNDYWLWQAITCVSPRIVICEYNSLFGSRYPVSVPYQPDFEKRQAHSSDLYFGASLPALCYLAERKGYTFVGSTSGGLNAFFVRSDVIGALPRPTLQDEYVRCRFRSSVDAQGRLTFLSGEERIAPMANMQVEDVQTGELRRVGELMR
jgi:hypothetical protein